MSFHYFITTPPKKKLNNKQVKEKGEGLMFLFMLFAQLVVSIPAPLVSNSVRGDQSFKFGKKQLLVILQTEA